MTSIVNVEQMYTTAIVQLSKLQIHVYVQLKVNDSNSKCMILKQRKHIKQCCASNCYTDSINVSE